MNMCPSSTRGSGCDGRVGRRGKSKRRRVMHGEEREEWDSAILIDDCEKSWNSFQIVEGCCCV